VSKSRRDQKKHAKCVHTSRWHWRHFLILRALFTMNFYHKAGQSIRALSGSYATSSWGSQEKRPDAWRENRWMPQHDNAPSHSSFLVRDFSDKHATTVLPQPPYSPDLAPADFFLFPKLKSTLKGRRFESIEAIKTNSLAHLRSIPKTAFQECFRTLKKHWQRCIQSWGKRFECDKSE
jgi:transposase